MKKTIFSSLIAMLLITSLSVLTSSCKKDTMVAPSELIVGTWDATSLTSEEEEFLVPGSGLTLVMQFDAYSEISGSKFTWTFTYVGEIPEVQTGTYALSSDGKVLTLRDSTTLDLTVIDVKTLDDKRIKFGDYFQTIEATKR